MTCRLLTAALCLTITPVSLSQRTSGSPRQDDPETLRTTTTLVVVPALVETPAKELVYSLTATDFLVTDNGVLQKVRSEHAADQPLSLVVLMQTGGSAVHQFKHYRNLETMLSSIMGGRPNQVSIVNFDSKPEAASPFTSNIAEWREAINQPDPGDDGAAILDSLKFTLNLLGQQPATNQKAILLISQPTDVGSKTPLKEIVRTAAETNTTIYTVTFHPEKTAFKDAFVEPPHLNPPINVEGGNYQAYFNLSEPLGMIFGAMRKNLSAETAILSGGEALTFDDQHQLDDALGTIATHIRNRYLLTFSPTLVTPGLHTLEVHLDNHPGLVVTARSSYWSKAVDKFSNSR